MEITINHITFKVDPNFLNQKIETRFLEQRQYKSATIRFQRAIEIKDNLDIENEGSSRKVVFEILLGKKTPENIAQQLLVNLNMIHTTISGGIKINESNLRLLYDMMWLNIQDRNKLSRDEYPWRSGPGIINSGNKVFNTLDAKYLNKAMEDLFIYIQDNNDQNYENVSLLIMFLFVYIHPFYDYNGKTSRILATWYLSNFDEYLSSLFLSFVFKVKRNKFMFQLGELRSKIDSLSKNQNHIYDLTPMLKEWSSWLIFTKKHFIKLYSHFQANGFELLDNHISTYCFIALAGKDSDKKWFTTKEIEQTLNFQASKQSLHQMLNKMIEYGVLIKKKPSKFVLYSLKI